MKRCLVRVMVCLVVGVVVNVLVAWAGAVTQWVLQTLTPQVIGDAELPWMEKVPNDWPSSASFRRGWETGLLHYEWQAQKADEGYEVFSVHRALGGWPMRSLAWVGMSRSGHLGDGWKPSDQVEIRRGLVQDGLRWPKAWALKGDPMAAGRRLPLRPEWPGFAVNTLVYGALAWGVLFAPGVVRRWRRKRRGACLKCGYELAGLAPGAVCPECGVDKKKTVGKSEALTDASKQASTLPRGE